MADNNGKGTKTLKDLNITEDDAFLIFVLRANTGEVAILKQNITLLEELGFLNYELEDVKEQIRFNKNMEMTNSLLEEIGNLKTNKETGEKLDSILMGVNTKNHAKN